jgi:hypothetical protein
VQQAKADEATATESLFASLAAETTTTDAQTPAPSPFRSGAQRGVNTEQPVFVLNLPVANVPDKITNPPVLDLNLNLPSESNHTSPFSNESVSTELNQTLDLSIFGDSMGLFGNSTEAFANAIGFTTFAGDDAFKGLILDSLFSLMMLDDFIAAELDEGMNGINATMDVAEMLNATAQSVNPPHTLAYVLVVPWMLIPFVFLILVVMAWRLRPNVKILPRISQYVMPLLCLLTMASTILAVIRSPMRL